MNDEHEHDWQLTEHGYTRTWSTEIDAAGTIHAVYGGSEDWSDDGDGNMHLSCRGCLATKEIDPELICYDDGSDIFHEHYAKPQDAEANAQVDADVAKGIPPF